MTDETNDSDIELEDVELESGEELESVADSARIAYEELTRGDETNENLQRDTSKTESAEIKPTGPPNKQDRRQKASKRGERGTEQPQIKPPSDAEGEPVSAAPILPPAHFESESREWFSKQPREVQQEVRRHFDHWQASITRTQQELSNQQRRYAQLDSVIQHYLPKWHNMGIPSEAHAIAQLAAFQDAINTNPTTGILQIMQAKGLTIDDLYEAAQGDSAMPQASQNQLQSQLTKEDIFRIIQEREQASQLQQAQAAAVSEIQSLRAQHQNGHYLWPELWDTAYLQRVQPLVQFHRETEPGISWSEATKRAVLMLRTQTGAIPNQGSPNPARPRLSRDDEINRARNASVSIRGRGNGIAQHGTSAKASESVRESAEAVWAMLNSDSH